MKALVLVLACAACGPQLQTLASQRHYREAVCAAADGSSDDRAFVRRALARDVDPKLHVQVVRPEELEHALAGSGDAERIAERSRFVRVRLETNVIPVDDLDADVAWTSNRQSIGAPIGWNTLAAITEERMPPPVTESTYFHRGTFLRGVAAFFSFGTSLLFTTFSKRSYTKEAPPLVYKRIAPAAYRLRTAMRGGGGCHHAPSRSKGVGLSCTWYVALDPTATGPAKLELTLFYAARRSSQANTDCRVQHTTAIQLGPLHDLEARTLRTFGTRMRPVRELTFEP